ncbi:MAG: septal ring lytic transglycosylase RlpA family protein [Massilia sp.]
MNVSRLSLAFIAPTLAAVLVGCATTPPPAPPHSTAHTPSSRGTPAAPLSTKPESDTATAVVTKPGGYYQDDGPGANPPPNLASIPDAQVRAEPYARYANRPYVVFGKTYVPMLDEKPFSQRGQGSWYGKKFHGQRTSSGEIYDMYKMTAAHPTLPIPSYARVTNVDNGKSVVVRINDRGPFHAGRVVDLSYAAAVKLGLMEKGSQQVELVRVLANGQEGLAAKARPVAPAVAEAPRNDALEARAEINELIVENRAEVKAIKALPDELEVSETAPAAPSPVGYYVQMGAFSRADKAADIRSRVSDQGWAAAALDVVRGGGLHKVLGGPFATRELAMQAMRDVPAALGLKPIVVKR